VAGKKRPGKGPRRERPAEPAMQRIPKPERLLNLVAFLLSSRTAVPFSRIKGRVAGYDDDASPEALEKRFDRDKAELRALGVPIVYESVDEHGHDGYRIPRDQYFLPEIRLNLEEAAALAVVQRYAVTARGDPLSRSLRSALRKILVDSPLTGAAAASVTEQHMLGVRSEEIPGDLSANLETLTDAVMRKRLARFKYYGIGRDEVTAREVEPYGLGWHDRHWYFVGRDRKREAVRQFRVDRIRGRARSVQCGGFQVPEDFDVADHVGRPAFRLTHEGDGERVSVQLAPEIAFMARDALRDEWELESLPDGSALLTFEANDRAAAVRYVAKHAERARIVAPPALRDEARAYFQAVLDAHSGEPTQVRRPARGRGRGGRS